MSRLAGQVAIVTGGSDGVAAVAAAQLSRAGAVVVVWDHDVSAFDDEAAGFRPDQLATLDFGDGGAVQAAAKAVAARFDKIDILVNSARLKRQVPGNGGAICAAEGPPNGAGVCAGAAATGRAGGDVDLTAAYVCCQAVLPFMRMRDFGRIVNVAHSVPPRPKAIDGHLAPPAAGLIGMTKSLARELLLTGITVNAVMPAAEAEARTGIVPFQQVGGIEAMPFECTRLPRDLSEAITFAASLRWSGTTGFTFDVGEGRALY